MPDLDSISPESPFHKWKWMVSDEDLEELKELEGKFKDDEED